MRIGIAENNSSLFTRYFITVHGKSYERKAVSINGLYLSNALSYVIPTCYSFFRKSDFAIREEHVGMT